MGILKKKSKPGTQAEIVANEVDRLKGMSGSLYSFMSNWHQRIFNMIWNNRKATPQEIFDEYGTDAADLFQFSTQIQTMAAALDSDYMLLVPPYEYTINADGTVTVGDKIT